VCAWLVKRRFIINVISEEIIAPIIVIIVGISLIDKRFFKIGCWLINIAKESRGGYTTGYRGGRIVNDGGPGCDFDLGIVWPKGGKASQVREAFKLVDKNAMKLRGGKSMSGM
jgi:hypothetical protein